MLDTETRRRIDSCRDILVGKVPDPKSQVEQITIALIYKFMDDMDAEAEELGGQRSFFAKAYAKYGWTRLMSPKLGGFEVLTLYSEAIATMTANPGIPALFRDIFKNAYLPYRDPETLKSFLKEIDGFRYDHSERLGDAFEYLLSVLGSQGDAGQFRTPRHIIDFMVEVIDPQKHESILDPACGTAGFLISAWKHILKHNSGKQALKPAERQRLAGNISGYDISPDMVRLSLVNMYLHGFTDPHIIEYDTLTSDERWNETADVILANPPFMSPKGGIRPHKRFSVPSSRSEVLFVDYMVEHLSPQGRAAIIVPEGIIFQSGTAYRRLREVLLKESLIGVISLPSGVFQPYSGVKTSILILDKRIAKSRPTILFSDVRAIGLSLGIKRTVTETNDLPHVLNDYAAYYAGTEVSAHSWLVERNVVIANDCNLSGERYRPVEVRKGTRAVRLKEVCTLTKGTYSSTKTEAGSYPLIVTAKEWLTASDYQMEGESVCVPLISSTGHGRASISRVHFVSGKFAVANLLAALQPKNFEVLTAKFLYLVLDLQKEKLAGLMKGAANVSMKVEDLAEFQIPLPPLAIQQEIVAEIEGYQKIIDGARQVVANYQPRIAVQPDWPEVELGKLCTLSSGGTPSKANAPYWNGTVPWVSAKDMKTPIINDAGLHISSAAVAESATRIAPAGSLLVLVRGMGLANGVPICELAVDCAFNQDIKAIQPQDNVVPAFLRLSLAQQQKRFAEVLGTAGHGTLKLDTDDLLRIQIALPPKKLQRAIVAEIEAEQALVDASKQLIARFEAKIKAAINRVWSEA